MHDHERDRIVIRRLADKIADLERRLHNVETAPQMPRTSVRGGFTRWQVEGTAEFPKVFIGADDEGDDVALFVDVSNTEPAGIFIGTNGQEPQMAVRNDDSSRSVLDIFNGTMFVPLISSSWQVDSNVNIDAQGRPTTTSASYVTLWRAWLPIGAGAVTSAIDVFPGANTADCRIQANVITGGTSAGAQTLVEETGLTSTSALFGPWTIPNSALTPAASPIGTVVELTVDLRRTAGASSVAVAPRWPVRNSVAA